MAQDDQDRVDQLTEQLQATSTKAAQLLETLGTAATQDDLAGIKSQQDALKAEVDSLTAEKHAAEQALEIKSMREQLTQLINQRTERKFQFNVNTGAQPVEPFPVTMYKAKHGDMAAKAALGAAMKAVGEATNGAGGYLVPPDYIQQLVLLRRATAPMLDHINTISGIKTNLVYVPTQTGVETVAWTAENATKVSTDEVFGQIAVNIFTLAGIAKVSNQLLEDSSPAVDQIVQSSLGRGLGIEMDRAILNGSGTGQPTGILNTAGVTVTAASAQTAASILDDIQAAIGRIQATYFGQPDCIVIPPRSWSKLQTAKDTTGRYLAQSTLMGNQMLSLPGVANPTGSVGGTTTTLFGIPLIVDANMPVNQTVGANTNRSSIIVGALKESWALMRDDIRMDVSAEAGTSFEQNQTWFRGECRMGFTAARLPVSLQIINDVGP